MLSIVSFEDQSLPLWRNKHIHDVPSEEALPLCLGCAQASLVKINQWSFLSGESKLETSNMGISLTWSLNLFDREILSC